MRKFSATIIAVLVFFVCVEAGNASGSSFNPNFFSGVEEMGLEIEVITENGYPLPWHLFHQESFYSPLDIEEIQAVVTDTFKNEFSQYGIRVYQSGKDKKQALEKAQKDDGEPQEFDESVFNFGEKNPLPPKLDVSVYIVMNVKEMPDGERVGYGAVSTKSFRDVMGKRSHMTFNHPWESIPAVFLVPKTKDEFSKVLQEAVRNSFKVSRHRILCLKIEDMPCDVDLGTVFRNMKKEESEKMP